MDNEDKNIEGAKPEEKEKKPAKKKGKKSRAGGKIVSALKFCYHCTAIVLIVFAAINIACVYNLFKTNGKYTLDKTIEKTVVPPSVKSPEFMALQKRVLGDVSEKDIVGLRTVPGLALHTSLPFKEKPVRNAYYTVGLENIRYASPDTDEKKLAKDLRGKKNIFIFGGSTTFGVGVRGDQTWPHYFTRLAARKGYNTFNFGVESYTQSLEIEKLEYLLKKGYRPKVVIFFDGLNDMTLAASNNYGPQDQFSRYGYFINRGENTSGSLLYGKANVLQALRAMPFSFAVKRMKNGPDKLLKSAVPGKDASIDEFDFSQEEFIALNYGYFFDHNNAYCKSKLIDYYRENIEYLDSLSKGFGFKYYVFLQPIGMLDDNNIFIRQKEFRESSLFRLFGGMSGAVSREIAAGKLDMTDLSDILKREKGDDKYVDASHYSPHSNKIVAEQVYRSIVGDLSVKKKPKEKTL